MSFTDPTKRFSDCVDYYDQYRPSYPQQALQYLINKFRLNSNHVIADIGLGQVFLQRYC